MWAEASKATQYYGSALFLYGLTFLGPHFALTFSLMFLFGGSEYCQELSESLVRAHNKIKVAPPIHPRSLSIKQGRVVGLADYP